MTASLEATRAAAGQDGTIMQRGSKAMDTRGGLRAARMANPRRPGATGAGTATWTAGAAREKAVGRAARTGTARRTVGAAIAEAMGGTTGPRARKSRPTSGGMTIPAPRWTIRSTAQGTAGATMLAAARSLPTGQANRIPAASWSRHRRPAPWSRDLWSRGLWSAARAALQATMPVARRRVGPRNMTARGVGTGKNTLATKMAA